MTKENTDEEKIIIGFSNTGNEDREDSISQVERSCIESDFQALEYYNNCEKIDLNAAFNIANILHTNKKLEEAAKIYEKAYRLHSKDPGVYPLAQSLLQASLICLLKAGKTAPEKHIESLKKLNIPFANYIIGIQTAWRGNRGREAIEIIDNAFEEFHTGEEIDTLYLELVRIHAPELLVNKDRKIGHLERIPRKIFLYWDQNPPEEIKENFDFHNRIIGFDVKIFNKEEAAQWLYENYGIEARTLFLAARHPAEAADFLRVHVTQVYGGWWLDADIRIRDADALKFLASSLANNVFFLTDNGVVHNDLYGTVANSVVGNDCLLSLYRNSYIHPGLFIAYKTGPGVFERAINRIARRALKGIDSPQSIEIYDHTYFDKVIHQFNTPYKTLLPSWHTS